MCLWDADNVVVLELVWLQSHAAQVKAQMLSFVEHVHEIATSSTLQGLHQAPIFEDEIIAL